MLLAINTAFMMANLALETDDGRSFVKDIDAKSKHSENVLKTIDELCQMAKTDISKLDTLAVVVGPGSFTGLRIGTAIAQALGCVNKNLKFLALSSLQLLAYVAKDKAEIKDNFVCALNALSGLYFVCEFDKQGIKISEQTMIDSDQFEKIDKTIFSLAGDIKSDKVVPLEIDTQDLLGLAKKMKQEKNFVELNQVLPVYIRRAQAEDDLLLKTQKK